MSAKKITTKEKEILAAAEQNLSAAQGTVVRSRRNIIKPPISEKSHDSMEKENQYTFLVRIDANKSEIKKEVARRYGVRVLRVNIVRKPGSKSRYRSDVSKKEDVKKAIVLLKKGDKIDAS